MKVLNYICIICLLTISISGFAQEEAGETIVREGDLVFVKFKGIGDNPTLRRAGTENLIPESYFEIYFSPEMIPNEFFREIFSKERADELVNGRLIMTFHCNGVKREIAYIDFRWSWMGKQNEDEFPLTLKELDLLETRIKAYPFKFYVKRGGKIDQFSRYSYPLLFDRLYNKPPPRKSDQPAEITESIVKNGDVAYIKTEEKTWMGTRIKMKRVDTDSHIPESYADAHLMTQDDDPHIRNQNLERLPDTLFKAIFSKERALEFGMNGIGCTFNYNAIKEEIVSIEFSYSADYPPTLKELDLLETKLKAYPFIYCVENGIKTDRYSTANFYIRLHILYEDVIGFGRDKKDVSIVQEGDLVYTKSKDHSGYLVLKRIGVEELIPESYSDAKLYDVRNVWGSIDEESIFREVFSKERVEELKSDYMFFDVRYNAIEEKIAYMKFSWYGKEESPLTLKELDLLESKFKSYPLKYKTGNKTRMNHFSRYSGSLDFSMYYYYNYSKIDSSVVQEGDLTYLMIRKPTRSVLKKTDTEKLVSGSYREAYLTTPGEDKVVIEKSLLREVFSKERSEELYDGGLICNIKFNAIKKEIAYIEFSWNVPIDFPLTLEEINLLETKLKNYPFQYHILDDRPTDQFSTYRYFTPLNRLYDE